MDIQTEKSNWRHERVPEVEEAFGEFSEAVFKDGALDKKTKEIIAVVVSTLLRCDHCVRSHTKKAFSEGATRDEIAEALSVAWEIGGATQAFWFEDFDKYLG